MCWWYLNSKLFTLNYLNWWIALEVILKWRKEMAEKTLKPEVNHKLIFKKIFMWKFAFDIHISFGSLYFEIIVKNDILQPYQKSYRGHWWNALSNLVPLWCQPTYQQGADQPALVSWLLLLPCRRIFIFFSEPLGIIIDILNGLLHFSFKSILAACE